MSTKKILFLGSQRLGARILRTLAALGHGTVCGAVTIDDRRDVRSDFATIVKAAADYEIQLYVARDRKHAEEVIRAESPDLCVVAGWYWLVPAEVIRAVPDGFIGIHNSLLPKYRGGSPLVWALINGDIEVGVSFFSFGEGLDDGPVWLQAKIAVGPTEYVGEVLDRLEDETLRIFRDGFPMLLEGGLKPRERDHAQATYCAMRLPEDGEIDWSQSAAVLFDFIRAQSHPYPGAFTFLDQHKLAVFRASLVPYRYDGTPGQVAAVDGGAVVVTCGGRSALRLEEVDAGSGVMPAATAIRTIRTRFPRYSRGTAAEAQMS